MADIELRAYVAQIEEMLAAENNDEAVAHARHVLEYFPKNLAVYRLLGKGYLEKRRFPDAGDIFYRVLSAAPDDFVAHVGLAIIGEEEEDLSKALGHMERAFEAQPSNAAIQAELRRLYGRRDGVEPARVRLTRGALARLYVRGEIMRGPSASCAPRWTTTPAGWILCFYWPRRCGRMSNGLMP